jgi:hypothetical protein
LNELAVELAKLCLWMTTAAKGKPLTFLDHHLRWGNSLVGARLDDVGVYPRAKKESKSAFTLPLERFQVELDEVLAAYETLYAKSSDDVDDVREKARIFDEEIYPALQPYRELLDLHTGVYFGNGLDETAYAQLGAAVADPADWTRLKTLGLDGLLAQHGDRRWFHWELEFPEVFGKDDLGFDIVIGNPPYVRQERLSSDKAYLQACYSDVYSGTADVYVFFLKRGVRILRRSGMLSYIVSNKWLRATYAKGLRDFLSTQAKLIELLDFGHSDIFKNTDTFPCILVVRTPHAEIPDFSGSFLYCDVSDLNRGKRSLEVFIDEAGIQVPFLNLRSEGWMLEQQDVVELMQKLAENHPKLREHVAGKMLNGVKTGLNQAFCIDDFTRRRLIEEDPKSEMLLRRLLRGRNIQRWTSEWDGEWIIVIPSSLNQSWPWSNFNSKRAEEVFRNEFPAIHRHFQPFRQRLIRRSDQGKFWWELRSCDYYKAFDEPKILVQGILYHSTFSLNVDRYFLLNSCYFIPTSSKYLLAVLNSRITWWYAFRILPHMKDEALHPHVDMFLDLPIPDPDEELKGEIEESVDELLSFYDKKTKDDMREIVEIEMAIDNLITKAFKLSEDEVETIRRTLVMRDPLEVQKKKLRTVNAIR